MSQWGSRMQDHLTICQYQIRFPLKCALCILLEDGKWKCTCKQTEMIHGSWLLFISCINYIRQWDVVKYIYNFFKTLLETNQTLLSSGVLTQAWLGWPSADPSWPWLRAISWQGGDLSWFPFLLLWDGRQRCQLWDEYIFISGCQ